MKLAFIIAIKGACFFPFVLGNTEVKFSYDPASPEGPPLWKDLPGSSCGGLAQSGVDVITKSLCDESNVDYKFKVWQMRANIDNNKCADV